MTLTKKTIENISIVGGTKVFARLLNAITLIVLTRLLTPSDFGLVAIAGLLISTLDQFRDFGFHSAVIQRKTDIEDSLKTGFTLRVSVSLILFTIAFVFAPYWAKFFNDQRITLIVRIITIKLVLDALSFIPETRLTKDLKFKVSAIPELLGRLTFSVVTIALAYTGFAYWSLVYGRVVQSVVYLIVMWFLSPWGFQFAFNKRIAKELFGYGKYILASGFVFFLISSLDNAVIGKIIGTAALGYYLIAYRWATFSMTEISNTFSRVMFPTYSTMSSNINKVKTAYMKSLKYTAMLTIPMTLGILAVADEFVIILLGEKWAPAILPLQILCIFGLFQSIGATSVSVYFSIGRPNISTFLNILTLILMVIFIIPVVEMFGIVGVATLMSSISVILFPINFSLLSKHLGVKNKEFLEIIAPPAVSAIVMTVSILVLKTYLAKNLQSSFTFSIFYLIGLVIFGFFIYSASLLVLTKGELKNDIKILIVNLKTRG